METDDSLLVTPAPAAGADRPVPCSFCDEDVFDRSGLVSDRIQQVAGKTLLGIQGLPLIGRL